MAGFKFRLDFLIKLRRRREEEATSRLAKRLASIRELEDHINSMKDKKVRLAEDLAEHGRTGRLTGPLLKLYSEYQSQLATETRKAEELLVLSRREEVKERAALMKAMTDRKLIEKIKDKKKETFQSELQYQEQNTMEELASLAKARRDEQDHTNVS